MQKEYKGSDLGDSVKDPGNRNFKKFIAVKALFSAKYYLCRMKFNETKLYSILNNRCPRCHKGHFFENDNPFALKKFDKMHKRCPHCGENFEVETGFYYGAMYVSYGLTVVFGILTYLCCTLLLGLSNYFFILIFTLLVIALMPLFYRIARLIWINIFIKYERK